MHTRYKNCLPTEYLVPVLVMNHFFLICFRQSFIADFANHFRTKYLSVFLAHKFKVLDKITLKEQLAHHEVHSHFLVGNCRFCPWAGCAPRNGCLLCQRPTFEQCLHPHCPTSTVRLFLTLTWPSSRTTSKHLNVSSLAVCPVVTCRASTAIVVEANTLCACLINCSTATSVVNFVKRKVPRKS